LHREQAMKYTIEKISWNAGERVAVPVAQADSDVVAQKILTKIVKRRARTRAGSEQAAFDIVPTPVYCLQCLHLLGHNPTCEQCQHEQKRLAHIEELAAIVERDRRMYGENI
jgi:hypothetical protein